MSLFPAYAPPGSENNARAIIDLTDDANDNQNSFINTEKTNINLEPEKVDKKREKHKKKRKSKHDERDAKKKKTLEKLPKSIIEPGDEFYLDTKRDYGNLKVSTLYNPARPQYDNLRVLLGKTHSIRTKKKQRNKERYYNMKYMTTYNSGKDENSDGRKKRKKKSSNDFIDISESGIQWDDDGIEKNMLDKVAQFNKSLGTNPYDVDLWLQYVKFQEEQMLLDIAGKRVTSNATARNLCHNKQLSILDTALKHNFNSIKLLSKKIKISEQSMPNEQYLAMLKQLITTPEIQSGLLNRAWFWYLDGVKYSMALCSVPTVKEMYSGAVKALSKAQKQNYQTTHIDIIYRLGLYLRQAGLWEQLWMLLKLNIGMNLAASKTELSLEIKSVIPKIDDELLSTEENKIISSGLPLHEVWSRIELIRSRIHWLPSNSESDDPQRIVFSSDFTDYIKPVINKTELFSLTVRMLRLLKIPLLPISHQLITDYCLDWEHDGIESCLPFVYEEINNFKIPDITKIELIKKVVDEFSEEPNYFYDSDYFKFVNHFMIQCSKWFEDDEKTALLTWWIRWIRSILIIYKPNLIGTSKNNKNSMVSNVRRIIKDVLRTHRENVFIYKEFSLLEAQVTSPQQGLSIMETCLKSLPCNRNVARIHLCRAYVEMALRDDLKSNHSIEMSIHVLISLALNKTITNESTQSEEFLDHVAQEFTDYSENLILAAANFDREIMLVEYIVPDITLDWICCQGWFLYLTRRVDSLQQFYNKISAATLVEVVESNSFCSKRLLKLREGFFQWYISILSIDIIVIEDTKNFISQQKISQRILQEFPSNTAIIWQCINGFKNSLNGRLQLNKIIDENNETSQYLALGLVFQSFINLYKKYDPLYKDSWQPGHSNRLFKFLQSLICHPVLKKCTLIWRMLIEFTACHTQQSIELPKKYLYQALDECPWNKALYFTGCIRIPSEFSALIDIMVEKQIRLHAMPEELQIIVE